jgi:DNA-binding LacI/PurR family transcriptional regulator
MARAIRTGNTKMVGFIGGDLCEEQVGCMLAGALDEANDNGYTLKILPHHDREDDARQMIRRSSELRLMGVVALHLPLSMLQRLYVEAQHCKYPLVLVDSRAPIDGVHQVVSDDEQGVEMAIDHLAGLGHRKIMMMSSDPISPLIPPRESAYRAAMQRHHLPVPEDYIVRGDYRSHAATVAVAETLLSLPKKQRPTAVFCAGDVMALALMQAAARLRVLIPQQLSVVGFANLKVAGYSVPPLTTIEQPFQEMGRMAVRRLFASLGEKGVNDASEIAHSSVNVRQQGTLYMLSTRLIERASTAAVTL